MAYAEPAESPRPIEPRDACCGRHSLAARAARSVSDAAAGIASVLIVAEVERAEAERLVGAHRASVKDKDPLAPGTGSAGRSPNARPCRSATVFDFPSRLARGRAHAIPEGKCWGSSVATVLSPQSKRCPRAPTNHPSATPDARAPPALRSGACACSNNLTEGHMVWVRSQRGVHERLPSYGAMPRLAGLGLARAAAEIPVAERGTWFDTCPGREGNGWPSSPADRCFATVSA